MEVKKLTPKQQKAAWIIGAALLVLHFLPAFVGSIRQQFSHSQHVQPVVSRPNVNAGPKPLPNPVLTPNPLAMQFVGIFQGQQLMPDLSNCKMTLEVRPAIARFGYYTGSEQMSCVPSPIFYRGALTAQRKAQLPNIIAQASPVSASMTGSLSGNAMVFHVDEVIGATPLHCGPNSYSISNFGSNQVMAQWLASPCDSGGHMILLRARG
jgi:hypothetical protein